MNRNGFSVERMCRVLDVSKSGYYSWLLPIYLIESLTDGKKVSLKMAMKTRKINPKAIFHSDRGVQYASGEFVSLLLKNKTVQSMSRKGDCWDNAVAESFFKTLKQECTN